MTTYRQQIIPVNLVNGLQLYATFYYPAENKNYKGTILYFHGGGLIFGEREDLPEEYIRILTKAGYGLLTFDYLLAPESRLPLILQSTHDSIEWFIHYGQSILDIDTTDYWIMGRSAGGYLALNVALQVNIKPRGIIVFYGYYTLSDANFNVPNRYYLHYPKVPDTALRNLIKDQPIVSASVDHRYPLYIAARQRGNWIQLILGDAEQKKNYDITKEQLTTLPPAFITAATQDPDVPFRQAKMLHKFIPDSELHSVDSKEHDFDRTHIEELGIEIYSKLVKWLDNH